eukprot:2458718-Amphidinium_carterae.1
MPVYLYTLTFSERALVHMGELCAALQVIQIGLDPNQPAACVLKQVSGYWHVQALNLCNSVNVVLLARPHTECAIL